MLPLPASDSIIAIVSSDPATRADLATIVTAAGATPRILPDPWLPQAGKRVLLLAGAGRRPAAILLDRETEGLPTPAPQLASFWELAGVPVLVIDGLLTRTVARWVEERVAVVTVPATTSEV